MAVILRLGWRMNCENGTKVMLLISKKSPEMMRFTSKEITCTLYIPIHIYSFPYFYTTLKNKTK